MVVKKHSKNGIEIAEVVADGLLITNESDGLDLVGTLYFQGYDRMILHQNTITPKFFDLKTGLAGEILQKFSNYRMRLVIVGEFKLYTSESLQAFIYECNQGKMVNMVEQLSEAIDRLSN